MTIIKPEKLKIGSRIGVIAPSGAVDEVKIFSAKKYFEEKGFEIILGKNLFKSDRFLAGSDEERLEDLHWAFEDKNIDAILCARGGYGAIRLLDKIDYELVRRNPKIFCGYSDVTALSLMFLKKAGLVSYSSPMFQSDFSGVEVSELSEKSFFKVLSGETETYSPTTTIKSGHAEGILWGGNLATVVSLCGTDFIPDEKFIFFAEDVAEPVYKIDKMFRQLIRIEKFRRNIAGLALGEFTDISGGEKFLADTFRELADELNVPTFSGFKFSHAKDKQTVPIGVGAVLDKDLRLQGNFHGD